MNYQKCGKSVYKFFHVKLVSMAVVSLVRRRAIHWRQLHGNEYSNRIKQKADNSDNLQKIRTRQTYIPEIMQEKCNMLRYFNFEKKKKKKKKNYCKACTAHYTSLKRTNILQKIHVFSLALFVCVPLILHH